MDAASEERWTEAEWYTWQAQQWDGRTWTPPIMNGGYPQTYMADWYAQNNASTIVGALATAGVLVSPKKSNKRKSTAAFYAGTPTPYHNLCSDYRCFATFNHPVSAISSAARRRTIFKKHLPSTALAVRILSNFSDRVS